MSKKRLAIIILILLLIVLNVLKLSRHRMDKADALPFSNKSISVNDLVISFGDEEEISGFKRNIFEINDKNKVSKPVRHNNSAATIEKPQPSKTPEEIKKEEARGNLAQYKCAGITQHNGKIQALILRDGQSYIVSPGDKLNESIVVEKIDLDTVRLHDLNADISATIGLANE